MMAREPLIWVELRELGDYLQMSRIWAGALGAHMGLSWWLPKLPLQSYKLCPFPLSPLRADLIKCLASQAPPPAPALQSGTLPSAGRAQPAEPHKTTVPHNELALQA